MEDRRKCSDCGATLGAGAAPADLCPKCLLKLGLSATGDGSSESVEAIPPAYEPAQRIGPYRLLQKVGEGGMGEVWEAEQTEPIRRKVALKLIKAGMDTKQVVARFESERQALALMDHPNIARVHDAGATDQGRPYFAMEYVAGEPITRYCDRHRLGTEERLGLFMQVCEGVQHAHRKGIIHRDLKPTNVLVTIREGKPVPKIIDFGVAKATQQRLTEKTLFTQLGVLVGTPAYMSPEQAELSVLDVDTRTDVYSLGVLLYELLVGALPFDPRELREAGFDEMRRVIREEEPSKPSTRLSTLSGEESKASARQRQTDPTSLSRALRGDLDWITMKALEKDRGRRYGSPADLAADIRRHLNYEPVMAGPPSRVYRARRFVRRHRLGVVAGTAVVLALLIGATAATVGFVRATRAEKIALSEAERANREAETSEQVSDFLVELFEVSDPSEARGNTITVREILDRGADKIERELASQPRVKSRLMKTMGGVYNGLGLYEAAEPLLLSAIDAGRDAVGEITVESLSAMFELAQTYRMQSRWSDAERLLLETVEGQRRLLGHHHRATLASAGTLADVYRMLGEHEKSETMLQEVLRISRETLGEEHEFTAGVMANLARLYVALGRYDDAEKTYRSALDAQRRVHGDDHPQTLITAYALANLHSLQGRNDESEALYLDTLEKLRRVLGEDHPRTLFTMGNLGDLYRLQGRSDEAEELLLAVVDKARRSLGEKNTLTRQAMMNLSILYMDRRDFEAAEALLLDLLPTTNRVDDEEPRTTLLIQFFLGELYRRQQRYDEAEESHRNTLEGQRRVLGEDHPRTLSTLCRLACVHAGRGERQQALALFEEAVDRGFEFWGDPDGYLNGSELEAFRSDPEFAAIFARIVGPTPTGSEN